MTPRSLRDTSPDGPRAALLDSLAFGFTIARALSGAYGGRIPVTAWREMGEMRRAGGEAYDAEVARTCEEAEARSNGKPEQTEMVVVRPERDKGSEASKVHVGGLDGDDHGRLQGGRGRAEASGAAEGGMVRQVANIHESGFLSRDVETTLAEPVETATGKGPDVAANVPHSGPSPSYTSLSPSPGQLHLGEGAADGVVARSRRANEVTDNGLPDWQAIREEAAELAPGPFGWVLYQERMLADADAGFPALSPFSLYTIDRFFLSGKRWLLWMAGRGFGKSTLTGRLATAIGFGVERRAAPGPAWVCPIVSVLPVDADRRLEDIQAIIQHAYPMSGGVDKEGNPKEIKIALGKSLIAAKDYGGNPLAWVSSASTIGNVSGPSSFAALVDEEEKILYGRAGSIVGSLAFTFRSRPRVYGMRVSSAMTCDDTLARACAKGNGSDAPLTSFVATLGPFIGEARAGLLAVASWEDAKGRPEAGAAIRVHAESLTAESWEIPTWLGHPSIGRPTEDAPWGPGDAAVATRIEAEVVDKKNLDGLEPWRYWLRECASVPTGGAMLGEEEHDIMGDPGRYADESRGRARRQEDVRIEPLPSGLIW